MYLWQSAESACLGRERGARVGLTCGTHGMPRSLQNETLQLFKGDYETFSEMSAAAAFRGADIRKRSWLIMRGPPTGGPNKNPYE